MSAYSLWHFVMSAHYHGSLKYVAIIIVLSAFCPFGIKQISVLSCDHNYNYTAVPVYNNYSLRLIFVVFRHTIQSSKILWVYNCIGIKACHHKAVSVYNFIGIKTCHRKAVSVHNFIGIKASS